MESVGYTSQTSDCFQNPSFASVHLFYNGLSLNFFFVEIQKFTTKID